MPPHSSLQPNDKDLTTILEFMEKNEAIRKERQCMVEQCSREEEQQKEELREGRYQEDADKCEKGLLKLLDSKERVHSKNQLYLLERKRT